MNSAPGAQPSHVQTGILLMILAVSMFAVMEAIAKYMIRSYPSPMVLWGRYLFHFLFVLPFFMTPARFAVLATGRPILQTVRSLAVFTASSLVIVSLAKLPLAFATTLVMATPLFVTALSPIVLGERVGPRRWIGAIIGFLGVIVVIRPSTDFDNWYALLPVGAGACYAIYQMSTRKLSFSEPEMNLFFYTALGGTVVSSAGVALFWRTPDLEGWALLAACGALTGLGQFCLIRAFRIAEASIISPFIYTQMIWAIILGLILFGHMPDRWTIVGATLIVASGLYIWHRERRPARRS